MNTTNTVNQTQANGTRTAPRASAPASSRNSGSQRYKWTARLKSGEKRPTMERWAIRSQVRNGHKRVRLFNSDFLDWFSGVHPIVPLAMWLPFSGFLMWRSIVVEQIELGTVAQLSAAGLAIWTAAEYFLHRFVFHFRPRTSFEKRVQYLVHGVHHADPQDASRLLMPPVPAVVLALLLYPVFRLFLGPVFVQPFFASFLVGYLCYDYTHFAVHHFRPRTRLGRFLKQHHMRHHYVSYESNFGVSAPFWDFVIGTVDEKKANASASVAAGSGSSAHHAAHEVPTEVPSKS
jgi:sterol desaturase/sphingolipid hydroxylase (fatty acid hydroxylase superfamily)